MGKEKLLERARDELFSHINRCGVLQAAADDQRHWMDETIDYIGERYPDLSDGDLSGLHEIGIRFCQPAIAHGADSTAKKLDEAAVDATGDAPIDVVAEVAVDATVEAGVDASVA